MPEPTFDSGEFRRVLGHYPTGVCVVTTNFDDAPYGAVMGSFASVSLDPPLVSFMPTRDSDMWRGIAATGAFNVNVMKQGQADVCNAFFGDDAGCFDLVSWEMSDQGSPAFADSMASIDCTLHSVIDAGDHIIVVGLVHSLTASDDADASPLLFFRGGYGSFEA